MGKTVITCMALGLLLFMLRGNFVYAANYKEFPVYFGEQYNLLGELNNYYSDAVFTVEDNTVVSVDSQGVMTALQPGITTVNVRYKDRENNSCLFMFDVEVLLEDGIYRIKNNSDGKYLSLTDIRTKIDNSLEIVDYSDSGNQELCQLWRIEHVENGELDEFIIRPYSDNNAIMAYSEFYKDIRIEQMPIYIDYKYTSNSIWIINSNIITTNESIQTYRKKLNTLNIYGSGSSNDTWSFELVTDSENGIRVIDEHYTGMTRAYNRYMSIGSKKTLEDLKIRVLSYDSLSENTLTWNSGDATIARVDSVSGEVVAVGEGTTTITVSKYVNGVKYSASYELIVKPYRDGFYHITNKQPNVGLKLVQYGSNIYLQHSNSSADNPMWYMQCLLNGTYRISIADYNMDNCFLGRTFLEDPLDETEYVILQNVTNNTADMPFWHIINTDLGNVIAYKGNASRSLTLLDTSLALLALEEPDYEDYESMWTISETNYSSIPKIYIHPYYDEKYLNKYTDINEMNSSISNYLNNTKDILERELGVEVVIEETERFELSEDRLSKLNTLGVNNTVELSDNTILWNQMYEIVDNVGGDIPYYRNVHKYILYTGHRCIDYTGKDFDGTASALDIILICCNNNELHVGSDRCSYATLHEISHTLGARDHGHTSGETCGNGDKCSICGPLPYRRPSSCAMYFDTYNPVHPLCNECVIEMKAVINAKCLQ